MYFFVVKLSLIQQFILVLCIYIAASTFYSNSSSHPHIKTPSCNHIYKVFMQGCSLHFECHYLVLSCKLCMTFCHFCIPYSYQVLFTALLIIIFYILSSFFKLSITAICLYNYRLYLLFIQARCIHFGGYCVAITNTNSYSNSILNYCCCFNNGNAIIHLQRKSGNINSKCISLKTYLHPPSCSRLISTTITLLVSACGSRHARLFHGFSDSIKPMICLGVASKYVCSGVVMSIQLGFGYLGSFGYLIFYRLSFFCFLLEHKLFTLYNQLNHKSRLIHSYPTTPSCDWIYWKQK